MLITLYGINNIGKTTHTTRLVERLIEEGHDAVRVKYPVYELHPSGEYLNEMLRSGDKQQISEEELQMWFVLNRYQFEPQLKAWLDAGKIVVAEDYIGTGMAWGIAKGANLEWLESLNQKLIREDLAILIDGQRAVDSIESGHLHEENHALIERCRQVHFELAARYGWKKVALQTEKNDTFELIWKCVAPHLPA